MQLHKIQGSCYYTDFNKETDRPTLGYIEGDKFSIMIDAGASQFHVEDYNNLISKEGLKKPSFTFVTHWHWDHTYGMHALDIPTFVFHKTQAMLGVMNAWTWTDEAMKTRLENKEDIEFADEHIRKEYQNLEDIKVVTGDIVYTNDFEIDLGNQTIDVMHVESSHSEDSIILYARKDKVVYVADAISVDYYNENYLDKDKMASLTEVLENLDFDICITGHNDPVTKDHLISVMKKLSK